MTVTVFFQCGNCMSSLRKAYEFPPDGGELVHNIGTNEVDGTAICPHCLERILRVRVQVRVTR